MDPKVRNLFIFFAKAFAIMGAVAFLVVRVWGETDPLRLLGATVVAVAAWRSAVSVYRRLILPPKQPLAYGKWAIVTGTLLPGSFWFPFILALASVL